MKSLLYYLLVFILVSFTSQTEINPNSKLKIFANRFTKQTDSKVQQIKGDFTNCNSSTASMLKQAAEDASLYYANDVFANIDYILKQIGSHYTYTYNWDLAIMTNANVTSSFSKFVTPSSNCMLVSTKFNFYNPTWAYMFRSWVRNGQQPVQTSQKGSKGSGFSASDVQIIKKIIDRISIQYPDDIQEQAQQVSQTLKKILYLEIEVMVTRDYVKTYAMLAIGNRMWYSYINKNVDLAYIVYARDAQ